MKTSKIQIGNLEARTCSKGLTNVAYGLHVTAEIVKKTVKDYCSPKAFEQQVYIEAMIIWAERFSSDPQALHNNCKMLANLARKDFFKESEKNNDG